MEKRTELYWEIERPATIVCLLYCTWSRSEWCPEGICGCQISRKAVNYPWDKCVQQ
ncbi:hypothetical protein E2C01_055361 [Portunus trituberculatus]|uniref:Uncharacterized protein n=1 Tax=Portunus trituberculatus TaxID=210409 RepID=A0A5B7GQZ3_PORTR|nr:hypothetical protein [Portunus trituberculatus]